MLEKMPDIITRFQLNKYTLNIFWYTDCIIKHMDTNHRIPSIFVALQWELI